MVFLKLAHLCSVVAKCGKNTHTFTSVTCCEWIKFGLNPDVHIIHCIYLPTGFCSLAKENAHVTNVATICIHKTAKDAIRLGNPFQRHSAQFNGFDTHIKMAGIPLDAFNCSTSQRISIIRNV